jgi:large subunit ribosomal protein L7e
MGKNPPKWLPGERVNETILLQRKSVEQLNAERLLRKDKLAERRQRHKAKIDAKRKRKLSTKKFIAASTILKHAQRRDHQEREFAKIGEKSGGRIARRKPEDTAALLNTLPVVLLVRAKGTLVPENVASAFRRLGLEKLYSGRLLLVSDPTVMRLVDQLKPFSIFGVPSEAQLEGLIRTRGAFWNVETKSRKLITGNLLVEQTLGQYNILCVEDLVDAIKKKSEHLPQIMKHLATFDFHPPRQLFLERHRTVHQKLEIVNPDSFASFLENQLHSEAKKSRKAKKVASEKKPAAVKAASDAVGPKKRPRED